MEELSPKGRSFDPADMERNGVSRKGNGTCKRARSPENAEPPEKAHVETLRACSPALSPLSKSRLPEHPHLAELSAEPGWPPRSLNYSLTSLLFPFRETSPAVLLSPDHPVSRRSCPTPRRMLRVTYLCTDLTQLYPRQAEASRMPL